MNSIIVSKILKLPDSLTYLLKKIKVFKSCLNCQKSCFSWGIIITDRNENICYLTLKCKAWFTAKIISFKCIFSIVGIILYFWRYNKSSAFKSIMQIICFRFTICPNIIMKHSSFFNFLLYFKNY